MYAETINQRITMDPQICHGKPCIRGLRYPVEVLLELLSAGMSTQDILEDYEDLEEELRQKYSIVLNSTHECPPARL